tara:strand:+ start:155 stop:352 length:198 start_codon:yes stop_codon:yes gene_type:complete
VLKRGQNGSKKLTQTSIKRISSSTIIKIRHLITEVFMGGESQKSIKIKFIKEKLTKNNNKLKMGD